DDKLYGEDGDDEVAGGDGQDWISGGAGDDRIEGGSGFGILDGDDGADVITGGGDIDQISGGAGDDVLRGDGHDDLLYGDAGADRLEGGEGRDRLEGGAGADVLTGGAGKDDFVYWETSDSTASSTDRITDFSQGEDVIDLSLIDADSTIAGGQAFTFVYDSSFHGRAGELRYEHRDGDTVVQGDTNGDGQADLEIVLTGTIELIEADFLL
ncbi:M10 family metallopeptidase C-terminal domain-containing protein, partial [Inquilinus limosus]|uniref:calcium-binding protein n=1 Tax=Inquilinus limosus TaxID=171674 RepID=UPI003F188054